MTEPNFFSIKRICDGWQQCGAFDLPQPSKCRLWRDPEQRSKNGCFWARLPNITRPIALKEGVDPEDNARLVEDQILRELELDPLQQYTEAYIEQAAKFRAGDQRRGQRRRDKKHAHLKGPDKTTRGKRELFKSEDNPRGTDLDDSQLPEASEHADDTLLARERLEIEKKWGDDLREKLTPYEYQVATLTLQGLTFEQIASKLDSTQKSVATMASNIKKKLQTFAWLSSGAGLDVWFQWADRIQAHTTLLF